MHKPIVFFRALLPALLLAGPALASSPDAWDELFAKSEAACIRASRLAQARVRAPVDFEGQVLRIVDGRQANNAPGTVYCLFDKRSGRVETSRAQR